jgi:hypothetical protein
LSGDIKALEKQHERALRIPSSFKDLSYEKRLEGLELTTLEERRVRADLIKMNKFTKEFENIDWHTGPRPQTQTQTRASLSNKYRFERDIFPVRNQNYFGHFVSARHNFFLNRIILKTT